ncbi:carboxymuconolactone decarboxylase family protein [Nocardioides marmoriginsengisoli]|uniref:Carboxymuconolactone decarboxylase family protein n=1 Tax=Nocardioides marmoriginsengisoli TaxID=661483 RepID=A0A3N0CHH0_9ACTN|nr:carboxymuconolactone decarboxylase family protein [Nocardioides marmoriginsengisoli]RNL62902.1 carboxymuconolactone decarboxylase family protein [Nocardioides marmoriginsengisoli]
MEWNDGLTGAAALQRHAPTVAEQLDHLVGAIVAPSARVAIVRRACAEAQDLTPLPDPASGVPQPEGLSSASEAEDLVLLRFAEQFSVDVSSVDDELRSDLWSALEQEPAQARGGVVAMTYVGDFVPRVRAVLDRLFAPSGDGWLSVEEVETEDATTLAYEFVRRVYNLKSLDPILSEMIRLRGARAHNCRLCKSLRSLDALTAGATESDFDSVDDLADDRLDPAQKAALALVDAIIWTPARVPDEVLDAVRAKFEPAQAVEIVLDVMRNAWNKTTVAVELDEPHVVGGVEVYQAQDDGSFEFGLSEPGR